MLQAKKLPEKSKNVDLKFVNSNFLNSTVKKQKRHPSTVNLKILNFVKIKL